MNINRESIPQKITPTDVDNVDTANASDKDKLLGMVGPKEFITYLGAAIYGYWENFRAMGFDSLGIANSNPERLTRASEGFQKLLDQNTGDGTIVALGFLGAEVLTLSIDKVSKKLGKKGIDPTTRFLSSLTFGVGLATYLETTTFMNNTVDIPGDLFGVGLGAAFILTSKLVAEHVTSENIISLSGKAKKSIEQTSGKFQKLSEDIAEKIKRVNEKIDDNITVKLIAELIAEEFIDLIKEIGKPQTLVSETLESDEDESISPIT